MALRLGVSVIGLSLAALAAACGEARPRTYLNDQQMKAVLKDLYVVEQGLQTTEPHQTTRDSLARAYSHDVLKRHGIEPEQFTASYQAYLHFPRHFKKLHDEMLQELTVAFEAPGTANPETGSPDALRPDSVARPPRFPLAPHRPSR